MDLRDDLGHLEIADFDYEVVEELVEAEVVAEDWGRLSEETLEEVIEDKRALFGLNGCLGVDAGDQVKYGKG